MLQLTTIKGLAAGLALFGGLGAAEAHHGGPHGVKLHGAGGVSVTYKSHHGGHFGGHHGFRRFGGHKSFYGKPYGGFHHGRHFGHGYGYGYQSRTNIVIHAPIRPYHGYGHIGRSQIVGRPVIVRPATSASSILYDEGRLGTVVRVTPIYGVNAFGRSEPIGYDQQIQFPDGRTATIRAGLGDPVFAVGEAARLVEDGRGAFLRAE